MTLLIAVLSAGAGIGLALMVAGLADVLPWRRAARRPRPVAASDMSVSVVLGGHDADREAANGLPRAKEELTPAAVAPVAQPMKSSAADCGPCAAPRDQAADGSVRAPGEPRVWVRLLGPARVEVDGCEVRAKVLGRPMELLCFYVLHPEGVAPARAANVLWPHLQPGRESEHFANALRRLRAGLRAATGDPTLMVIEHVGQRYRIDRSVVDADVWRLEAALAQARQTSDPAVVMRSLEVAGADYHGVLADGALAFTDDADQELRTAVVDAFGRVAELCEQAGDLHSALTALERAFGMEPATESNARRLMRVQAQLGRVDAIRRTYRRLRTALAEFGELPGKETTRLRDTLLNAHPTDAIIGPG